MARLKVRTAAEKKEIIHLVEHSQLPVRRTLAELQIPPSTFYRWYQRFQADGARGLEPPRARRRQFWNRLPPSVQQDVVTQALARPEDTPRQIAWSFTQKHQYFVSESSVYRVLKRYDLITSPAFQVVSAAKEFRHPTRRVHELWQTDFTYFKILRWGWYYLSTVIDDYSRYILAWRLVPTMTAADVEATLQQALAATGVERVSVRHRPRLLSDNGPCYLSQDLRTYLRQKQIQHTRCAPYHPMTQGKIERYHRTLKNVVLLQNYFEPWVLEREVAHFVDYYNHQRYHEALHNLTPADVYLGRTQTVLTERAALKARTLELRRQAHQLAMARVN